MGLGGGLWGVGYLGLVRELLAIDSVLLLQLLRFPLTEAGKTSAASAAGGGGRGAVNGELCGQIWPNLL